MSIPHWSIDPDVWDRLRIGSFVLPGVWRVTYTLERDIDRKKAGGVDGARIKDKGYKATELTFLGQLVELAEWEEMQRIFPYLHPRRKGASREAFQVDHPGTRIAGIASVYIVAIEAPELDHDKILNLSIKAIEYVPVPKKVAPSTGQVGGTLTHLDIPPDSFALFPGMKGPLVE